MAITIVGTNQGGVKTDGTNVTLTFSTGANAPQPGDHIYVFGGYVAGGSNYGPNTANGTYEQLLLSTSGTNTFGLWRLVVGASPPTVVVCQGDANAAHGIAYGSMVIRGADTLFDALTYNNRFVHQSCARRGYYRLQRRPGSAVRGFVGK